MGTHKLLLLLSDGGRGSVFGVGDLDSLILLLEAVHEARDGDVLAVVLPVNGLWLLRVGAQAVEREGKDTSLVVQYWKRTVAPINAHQLKVLHSNFSVSMRQGVPHSF